MCCGQDNSTALKHHVTSILLCIIFLPINTMFINKLLTLFLTTSLKTQPCNILSYRIFTKECLSQIGMGQILVSRYTAV